MSVPMQPRNDYVVVRIVELGETPSGIAMSQHSIQGKEFIVEAIGPDVEYLEVGNKVLMLGRQNAEYFPVPNTKDLIVIKQEFVVLVYMGEGE